MTHQIYTDLIDNNLVTDKEITYVQENFSFLHNGLRFLIQNNKNSKFIDFLMERNSKIFFHRGYYIYEIIGFSLDEFFIENCNLVPEYAEYILRNGEDKSRDRILPLIMPKNPFFSAYVYDEAFAYAASMGYYVVVKELIEQGMTFYYHCEALCLASENGKAEIVKLLLDNGANIHSKADGPIRFASRNGHYEVVKLLLEKGIDVHTQHDIAIMNAVDASHLEMVKLLLDNGANINAQDGALLSRSCWKGKIEIVKLLLERGADIHKSRDSLKYAVENYHYEIVKLLLQNGGGTKYNDHGIDCKVSLMYNAIMNGRMDMVNLLIEYGGDINKCHQDFILKIIVKQNYIVMVKFLLDSGMRVNYLDEDIKFETTDPTMIALLMDNGAMAQNFNTNKYIYLFVLGKLIFKFDIGCQSAIKSKLNPMANPVYDSIIHDIAVRNPDANTYQIIIDELNKIIKYAKDNMNHVADIFNKNKIITKKLSDDAHLDSIIRDIATKHYKGKMEKISMDDELRQKIIMYADDNYDHIISILSSVGYPCYRTCVTDCPFSEVMSFIKQEPYFKFTWSECAPYEKFIEVSYYDFLLDPLVCRKKCNLAGPNRTIIFNAASGELRFEEDVLAEKYLDEEINVEIVPVYSVLTRWGYTILRYKIISKKTDRSKYLAEKLMENSNGKLY